MPVAFYTTTGLKLICPKSYCKKPVLKEMIIFAPTNFATQTD
jgi:hypothetical protein